MTPQIYTVFPADTFHYTCAGCGLCCQGNGMNIDLRAEGPDLLRLHPALQLFVTGDGSTPSVANGDSCWFFDPPSGLCSVEVEVGRAAKPMGCRLFPYEVLGVHSDHLVVTLNFLCPLSLDGGTTTVNEAGFVELYEELDLGGLVDGYERLEGELVMASERQIRDRSTAASFEELLTLQCTLYDAAPLDGRAVIAGWNEALGQSDAPPSPEVDRTVGAMIPILRAAYGSLGPQRLPRLILGARFFAQHSAEMGPLTPKRVFTIAAKFKSTLLGLTFLDERPALPRGYDPQPVHSDNPTMAAVGRALRANRRRRLSWRELLAEAGAPSGPDLLAALAAGSPWYEAMEYPD